MKTKIFFYVILLIISALSLTACPGLFDRGLNVDEDEQCYVLEFEVGTQGDGNGEFVLPMGIAVNPSNKHILVTDMSNNRIQVFDESGVYLSSFGENDLIFPRDISITDSGIIYVSDKGNNRIVRYDSEGSSPAQVSVVVTDNEAGSGVGEMNQPEGIGVDAGGAFLAVADAGNNRMQILNIGSGTWEEYKSFTGISSLSGISDIATDTDTPPNFYITQKDKHRFFKISNTGSGYDVATDTEGSPIIIGKDGGVGEEGTILGNFSLPRGIAIRGTEPVYIADTSNNRIQESDINGIIREGWLKDGITDGNSPGHDEIVYPVGIDVDSEKNVFVVESTKYRFKKFSYRCSDDSGSD